MRTLLKDTTTWWKNKLTQKERYVRVYRSRLSRRDAYILSLESELSSLKKQTEPHSIANYHYPAQMIVLAVFMVVFAGCSLRGAAKSVSFFSEMMGWSYGVPSASTVRDWVLRCGYQSLVEEGNKLRGEFVAIVDESIQIGKEKLLLLLAYPAHLDEQQCASLTHKDVQVLGVSVQSSWIGKEIESFIRKQSQSLSNVSIVRVISDRGTNLLSAWKQLNWTHISDCTHWMMNISKALFKDDEELSILCGKIGKLRQRLTLTDYAFLLPPTLRDKDRFCRLFHLEDWFKRIEIYRLSKDEKVRSLTAFVTEMSDLRLRLKQVHQLVLLTSQLLKRSGLSQWSYQLWQQKVKKFTDSQEKISKAASIFIAKMEQYFIVHQHLYQNGERFLCCSEVIESVFGRYKNKGGVKVISADVLSIALYQKELSMDWVELAMRNVPIKKIHQWQKDYVCENRYGLMRRMKKELKQGSKQ